MRGVHADPWEPAPKPAGASDGQIRVTVDYAAPRHVRRPPARPRLRRVLRVAGDVFDLLTGSRMIPVRFGPHAIMLPARVLIVTGLLIVAVVEAECRLVPASWWADARAWLAG